MFGGAAPQSAITLDGFPGGDAQPLLRLVPSRRRGGAIVSGEPALAELFFANQGMILRYFRAHGAADHAEDLLQELWLKIQRTSSVGQVSRAYLMKMAHNLLLDEERAVTRRRRRDRTWQVDGAGGFEVDPAPGAEQTLISRQSLLKMENVLRSLGPRTESILRRHRIDGVPQKELALAEGLSLSAIEKHLQKAYRAIAAAQIELDGSGEDL
jgi:RNA polymerase sigma factor (sigma-70 family)